MSVIDQIRSAKDEINIKLSGEEVEFTNLDKVYYPKGKITKRDVILYYAKIADKILPYLKDRPVTLRRYPDGINGEDFFQRNVEGSNLPNFVETVKVHVAEKNATSVFPLVNNIETLLLFAQWGTIEFHPWYSLVTGNHGKNFSSAAGLESSNLNYPDAIVFDLDPYIYKGDEKGSQEPELNAQAYNKTVEVAKILHQTLNKAGYDTQHYKLSGKTGIHIFVPISRTKTYSETRKIAQDIGKQLSIDYPDLITTEWRTKKRKGRIFFDANQNSRGKTLASAYSLRPTETATVAMPVSFSQLSRVYPADYTIKNVA